MREDRRRFLCQLPIVAAVVAQTAGCNSTKSGSRRLVLGSISDFKPGWRYLELYKIGVLRDTRGLAAISMTCTHEPCALKPRAGGELVCPCHGAEFDAEGSVTRGPAKNDLPWYQLSIEGQELIVHLDQIVEPEWRLQLERQAN